MSPSRHSTTAVEIEDDPPHEIYSSLVGSSINGRDSSSKAYARGSLHATSSTNNNRAQSRAGATMILTEDEDYPSASSNEQFMQFYRKSCSCTQLNPNATTVEQPNKQQSDATKRCQLNRNRSQHSMQKSTQQTTKAERKRMARRQREIEIARDRHISMLLRDDVSEQYASLYRQLHR
jgi:hypothetical protein